jgi:DNA helicase-2/ATP-dependent DNA helicase PcrA
MKAELTESQAAAVESEADQVLVIGGPGSRKTQTIVERIRWLLDQGADPNGIAVISYTNEAAQVVETRLQGQIGFCGTLHGFCLRHITENMFPDRELRVIDDEERMELLFKAAQDCGVKATAAQLLKAAAERLEGAGPLIEEAGLTVAVKTYQTNALFAGLVDYESILVLALDGLRRPEAPRTLWQHLIVDEFQDAATIDAMIYNSVATMFRFFVGDPMQAIFGFRGGNVTEFSRRLQDPAWCKFYLMENWRSGPEICLAATKLAMNAVGPPRPPLVSAAGGASVITFRSHYNEAEEALATLEEIRQRMIEGLALDQMAVLARTNAVAAGVADALEANGVAVRRMITPEQPGDWRLALAALEVLARPASLGALTRWCRRVDPRFDEFATKMEGRGDKLHGFTLKTKIPITGDADKLEDELSALYVGDHSIELIKAKFLELPATASLLDLANALALEGIGRQMKGEGVFCGTIHSAKGREWDAVFLVGAEDEAMPGRQKSTDVEEERRVFYVGITRARRILQVSWARSRREKWGRGTLRNPSRFIAEAGLTPAAGFGI